MYVILCQDCAISHSSDNSRDDFQPEGTYTVVSGALSALTINHSENACPSCGATKSQDDEWFLATTPGIAIQLTAEQEAAVDALDAEHVEDGQESIWIDYTGGYENVDTVGVLLTPSERTFTITADGDVFEY